MSASQSQGLYTSLESGQIRRVRVLDWKHNNSDPIQCSLEVPSTTEDEYTAISYTWGAAEEAVFVEASPGDIPDANAYDIKVNDHTMSITPNLFHLLLELRQTYVQSTYYWIDAICINQQDSAEKEVQIGRMGQIYRQADRTFVWLGRSNPRMPRVHAMVGLMAKKTQDELEGEEAERYAGWSSLNCLTDKAQLQRLGIEDATEEDWVALLVLLQRRWFSRVWTFQEIALPRACLFRCGHLTFDWAALVHISVLISKTPLKSAIRELGQQKFGDRPLGSFDSLTRIRQAQLVVAGADIDFSEQLQLWHGVDSMYSSAIIVLIFFAGALKIEDASDPRDKIFGVLGLVSTIAEKHIAHGMPLGIRADHSKTAAQVYLEVMTAYFREVGSLTYLSRVQSLAGARTPDLPTWVLDFDSESLDSFLVIFMNNKLRPQPLFDASRGKRLGFSIEGSRLRVRALRFATVTHIGDDWAEFASVTSVLEKTAAIALLRMQIDPDIVEKLWQLIICLDIMPLRNNGAERERLRQSFRSLLFYLCLNRFLRMSDEQGWTRTRTLQSQINLLRLAEADRTKTIPTLAELVAFYESFGWREDGSGGTYGQRYRQLRDATEPWCLIAKNTWAKRRILLLDSGHLAMGPEETLPGDELCILADGARSPFLLRPMSGSAAETGGRAGWRFVGESYVPGIMNGEAVEQLEAEGQSWEALDIY